MPHKTISKLVLGLAVAVAACVATARATPSSGFTATTLAVGRLDAFEVFNHASLAPALAPQGRHARKPGAADWLSLQRTQGPSDLYVQSNLWTPGGTTGWHSHPGHSLIVVTEGAVTVYDAEDGACTPHRYSAGMAFVDKGGDHVHVIRNEDSVDARTVAVQLIPAGAGRRIDAAANPNCPF